MMTDEEFVRELKVVSNSDYKEMVKAYPTVSKAITFTELIFCSTHENEGPISVFDMMVNASFSPDEILKWIIKTVKELPVVCPGDDRILKLALEQMNSPEYAQYIAGKMGCV